MVAELVVAAAEQKQQPWDDAAEYKEDVEHDGGHLKFGQRPSDMTMLDSPMAYNIVFGPDECGYVNRTHLTSNLRDIPHLFRLVTQPDSTVRVEIDEETTDESQEETEEGEHEPVRLVACVKGCEEMYVEMLERLVAG